MEHFHFPRWTNKLKQALGAGLLLGPVYIVLIFWFGASPKTLAVGYAPEQPVPFSHARHAGELGLDCRYCHTTVEKAARAAIPQTSICMNCHKQILKDDDRLQPVRDSAASGEPIHWVRVHDLPDYVYFDHSVHVNRGVGCKSCHGRIDQMDRVAQHEPLSMGWCLNCHRNPAQYLRPYDQITSMTWAPAEEQVDLGLRIQQENHIKPSESCSTCHR